MDRSEAESQEEPPEVDYGIGPEVVGLHQAVSQAVAEVRAVPLDQQSLQIEYSVITEHLLQFFAVEYRAQELCVLNPFVVEAEGNRPVDQKQLAERLFELRHQKMRCYEPVSIQPSLQTPRNDLFAPRRDNGLDEVSARRSFQRAGCSNISC